MLNRSPVLPIHIIYGRFRNLSWRYLLYIRPMWGLCKGISSQHMAKHMVQYLHFGILEFALTSYHSHVGSSCHWSSFIPAGSVRLAIGCLLCLSQGCGWLPWWKWKISKDGQQEWLRKEASYNVLIVLQFTPFFTMCNKVLFDCQHGERKNKHIYIYIYA